MRVVFKKPTESLPLDPDLGETDKLPACDVRKRCLTTAEIIQHIKSFSHGYWSREDNPIRNDEKMVEDIEQDFRRRACGIPEQESAFGHIGGLSDYGLCYYIYLKSLDDSFGITGHTTYKWNKQTEDYLKEVSNNHQAINNIKNASGNFSFIEKGRRKKKLEALLTHNNPITELNDSELKLSLEQLNKFWGLLTINNPVNALLTNRDDVITFGGLIDWYIEFFITMKKLKKQS